MDWFLYDRDFRPERVNAWCPLKGRTHLKKPVAFTRRLFKLCMTLFWTTGVIGNC